MLFLLVFFLIYIQTNESKINWLQLYQINSYYWEDSKKKYHCTWFRISWDFHCRLNVNNECKIGCFNKGQQLLQLNNYNKNNVEYKHECNINFDLHGEIEFYYNDLWDQLNPTLPWPSLQPIKIPKNNKDCIDFRQHVLDDGKNVILQPMLIYNYNNQNNNDNNDNI